MSPELIAVVTLNAVLFGMIFKVIVDMGAVRERLARLEGPVRGLRNTARPAARLSRVPSAGAVPGIVYSARSPREVACHVRPHLLPDRPSRPHGGSADWKAELNVDDLIGVFDRGLRTLAGVGTPASPAPDAPEGDLTEAERAHAAGLMRVNHTGEVCAQALYEGQAMTARRDEVRDALEQAAAEEVDHLAWCRQRLDELDARPSVLDPLFFAASFLVGAAAGAMGDRVSLGFVEATEDQVVRHLDRHLADLPEGDARSRAIVEEMRADEARHGVNALRAGGRTFPDGVKQAMTVVSRIMTESTYRI